MATTSKEFYPHPDVPTPPDIQYLMDFLGCKRYGNKYDPSTGCVEKDQKLVVESEAPIYDRLLRNKFIRHYAKSNKGYGKGNGLLVLCIYNWSTVIGIITKLIKEKKNKFEIGWKQAFNRFDGNLFPERLG